MHSALLRGDTCGLLCGLVFLRFTNAQIFCYTQRKLNTIDRLGSLVFSGHPMEPASLPNFDEQWAPAKNRSSEWVCTDDLPDLRESSGNRSILYISLGGASQCDGIGVTSGA